MDNIERKPIPKNAFDAEYFTEWLREVRFLTEKGIKYTFVRKTPEYGISQYKYKKTPALFAALIEFYCTVEAERAVRKNMVPYKRNDDPEEALISPKQLQRAQEILEKAVKQGVIKETAAESENTEITTETTAEKDDTV